MFASTPVQAKPDKAYYLLKSRRFVFDPDYIRENTNLLRKDFSYYRTNLKEAIQANSIPKLLKCSTPWDCAHRDLDPLRSSGDGISERINIFFKELYVWLMLANDSRCDQETRLAIYQRLIPQGRYLRLFKSFFKSESIAPYGGMFNQLHLAAALNLKEQCQHLLSAGYKLDVRASFLLDMTPLGFAIIFGHLDLVNWLLSKGAKTDEAFADSEMYKLTNSPLCIAAMEGHHDVVHCILDRMSKAPTEREQRALLGAASIYGRSSLLMSLLTRFKIDIALLFSAGDRDPEMQYIRFGVIEAGIRLPSNAPADLLEAQTLWNELHPLLPEQTATIDDSSRTCNKSHDCA